MADHASFICFHFVGSLRLLGSGEGVSLLKAEMVDRCDLQQTSLSACREEID